MMDETKIREIIGAMQGITYLEWQKLSHCIDIRFQADVNTVANNVPLADADKIVESYNRS